MRHSLYKRGGRATFGAGRKIHYRRKKGRGFKENFTKFAKKVFHVGKKAYNFGNKVYKYYKNNPHVKQTVDELVSAVKNRNSTKSNAEPGSGRFKSRRRKNYGSGYRVIKRKGKRNVFYHHKNLYKQRGRGGLLISKAEVQPPGPPT